MEISSINGAYLGTNLEFPIFLLIVRQVLLRGKKYQPILLENRSFKQKAAEILTLKFANEIWVLILGEKNVFQKVQNWKLYKIV